MRRQKIQYFIPEIWLESDVVLKNDNFVVTLVNDIFPNVEVAHETADLASLESLSGVVGLLELRHHGNPMFLQVGVVYVRLAVDCRLPHRVYAQHIETCLHSRSPDEKYSRVSN